MTEKKRLSEEEYEKNLETVKKIAEFTEEIAKLVPNLTGASITQAYDNSVKNLRKKNEIYSAEKARPITPEEKELLSKIRKGEIKISPIEKKEDEVSTDEHVGKKGKRNN